MEGTIADVRCTQCGAPAKYDIVAQNYHCAYCGGRVEISEAQAQRQGFRIMQQGRIRQSAAQFHLAKANCSGCGAEIVFEENEAMANCAFCGRALVRRNYTASDDMPEMMIPFRLTREEAAGALQEWCGKNAGKAEARHLKRRIAELQGFYLPYELIRGPVSCRVSRMDSSREYHCRGYVDDSFVNCSLQMNNLLLDAMEPFALEDLQPFDFACAAGQRIKIRDVDETGLIIRINEEVSGDYAPTVRKTLETEAVEVSTDPADALRMPVLLPAYYLNAGKTAAAVNGQTGKVSVLAEKESHYFFLPWWLKAIVATAVITAAAFAAMRLFGLAAAESALCAGALALVTFIVTLCAYSDTVRNRFKVEARRKIFTSSGGPLRREGGTLVRGSGDLRREVTPPVFFETLDGREQPVQLVFSSFRRKLRTALLALVVLFLPVIIALFLNGFDFERLTLGGSAVWFCIMVPVIPIYVLKFSVIELYERPWIYTVTERGKRKRRREKHRLKKSGITGRDVLRVLFVPPVSLAVWAGIVCFCIMCYLTAFGFD